CRDGRCPSIASLEQYVPRQTSKVYAADGRFITELGLERRTLTQLKDIPKHVRDAVVITEDKRFYRHDGIDYFRIFGAVLRNIKAGGYAQGFSTITMQLARNVFSDRISREKTLLRKIKEARVARAIERRYSKDKILELYLNQVYLGNGAYGVETASQRYFGKSVRDVTVAEAAMLAGLLKGPERYNPRRFATGARSALRQAVVRRRVQGVHHPRRGHADGGRARARESVAGHRGGPSRQVHPSHVRSVPRAQRRRRGNRCCQLTLSAGQLRGHRSAHRRCARHGGRP
ncbi:MAG: penicillin-binding protein, partial [Gemmatimonadaceae bacterium]|nr:penicillin-binding protein [Gemmatimonadaceae bacterium]